jgi:hypothetical protein
MARMHMLCVLLHWPSCLCCLYLIVLLIPSMTGPARVDACNFVVAKLHNHLPPYA